MIQHRNDYSAGAHGMNISTFEVPTPYMYIYLVVIIVPAGALAPSDTQHPAGAVFATRLVMYPAKVLIISFS